MGEVQTEITLVINEAARQKLGLTVEETNETTVAGGNGPQRGNGAGKDLLEKP